MYSERTICYASKTIVVIHSHYAIASIVLKINELVGASY